MPQQPCPLVLKVSSAKGGKQRAVPTQQPSNLQATVIDLSMPSSAPQTATSESEEASMGSKVEDSDCEEDEINVTKDETNPIVEAEGAQGRTLPRASTVDGVKLPLLIPCLDDDDFVEAAQVVSVIERATTRGR